MKFLSGSILAAMMALVLFSSCTVRYSRTKSGYEETERQTLKRIMILTQGPPLDEKTAKLLRAVIRDFVSHHNEYILYPKALNPALSVVDHCAAEKMDGILVANIVRLNRVKDEVEFAVESSLISCRDQSKVWEAYGANTYPAYDSDLFTIRMSYRNRFGSDVEHLVGAFYQLFRQLYGDLPVPVLSPDDVDLKIDVDSMD